MPTSIRSQLIVLSLCGALAMACGRKAPPPQPVAPAAPDADIAAPTPVNTTVAVAAIDTVTPPPPSKPDTVSTSPAAPDTVAAPTPPLPGQQVAPATRGVISAARFTLLRKLNLDGDDRDPPTLSLAKKCAAASAENFSEDCLMALSPGVVGVRPDGAVALLTAESEGGCGDWGPMLSGVIAKLPSLRAGVTKPFPDPEVDDAAAGKAAWAWLTRLPEARFQPAQDLVLASVAQPSGIRSHVPLVVLASPLKGWLIDALAGDARATFRLVTPDRGTAHPLGTIANTPGGCEPGEPDNPMCSDFTAPNIAQASRNSKGALPHSRTRPTSAGGRISGVSLPPKSSPRV
jgi:hypothetical protein